MIIKELAHRRALLKRQGSGVQIPTRLPMFSISYPSETLSSPLQDAPHFPLKLCISPPIATLECSGSRSPIEWSLLRYESSPAKTEVFFSGSRRAGLLEQDMKRLVEPGLFDIMVGRNPVSLEACPGGCQLGSSIGTHIRAGLCSQSSKL